MVAAALTLASDGLLDSGLLRADITLPPIFSDHALLQRSPSPTKPTAIWGTATPGEHITLTLVDALATASHAHPTPHAQTSTQADVRGRWQANLDLSVTPEGPHTLIVTGDVTPQPLTRSDILIGDVWLCSGQSNMAWRLHEADSAPTELARPANPRLRQFLTVKKPLPFPADTIDGRWIVADGADRGLFTAIGYHFADAVQNQLDRPLGLLDASVGGTPIEPWMSLAAFEPDPDLRAMRDRTLQRVADHPAQQAAYLKNYYSWAARHDRTDSPDRRLRPKTFAHPRVQTTLANGWTPITLPSASASKNAPGAIWFRKTIHVAPAMASLYLVLQLGEIHGFHAIYWNGKLVSETTPENPPPPQPRPVRITLPAADITEGDAILAIRIFNPLDAPALGTASTAFQAGPISLTGEWLAKTEFTLPPLTDNATNSIIRATYPSPPPSLPPANDRPAYLFNALVHPLTGYAIRGILWYQGESNTTRAAQYARAFPLLIADWRARWSHSRSDLPFYFCQLAAYGPIARDPAADSAWAALREAQTRTAATVPHTGQAVLIDLGEEADIHPRNKRDVGQRLARLALADTYASLSQSPPIVSGPVFRDMTITGDTVRIRLSNTPGGLVAHPLPDTYRPRSTGAQILPLPRNAPDSQLEGFAIRDASGTWNWANARIESSDTIVLASPRAPHPTAVRYAWADNPIGNLYNTAGLPAVPFRTDFPSAQ